MEDVVGLVTLPIVLQLLEALHRCSRSQRRFRRRLHVPWSRKVDHREV